MQADTHTLFECPLGKALEAKFLTGKKKVDHRGVFLDPKNNQ